MGPLHYDAIVIGAGFSGLAAGIRLAQFERKVVVLERHALWGGLNSFYKRAGRRLDTGLHALTNFAPASAKSSPLAKIVRQLRIDRDALRLGEQSFSEIVFPSARLVFANGGARLAESVAAAFPAESERFAALVERVRTEDAFDASAPPRSARAELDAALREPLLRDMLLCAVCYYGSAQEDDVDWRDFVVLFRSIFLEGFARPEGGVKTLLDVLVRRYKELGGELRMHSGVTRLVRGTHGALGVVLEDGTELTADRVFSSAGLRETLALAGEELDEGGAPRLSFLESTWITREPQRALGHDATITFFSTQDRFRYARPDGLVDVTSGVICCSDNYAASTAPSEGVLRVTVPAHAGRWCALAQGEYVREKARCVDEAAAVAARFAPDPRPRSVFHDAFTPRTIVHYTSHHSGAIYGSPVKRRDGRTGIENLFVIGTDQGLVGIVGALLSGITMANQHALVAARP
jgi:phytoene dehydrogenase-like protein